MLVTSGRNALCRLVYRNRLSRIASHGFRLNKRGYAAPPKAESDAHQISHNDSFLQDNASIYVDNMYTAWKNDPASVHVSWQAYFHNVKNGHVPIEQVFFALPGLAPSSSLKALPRLQGDGASSEMVKLLKFEQLVQAYQRWGHQYARTNPLHSGEEAPRRRKELTLEHYGLANQDLDFQLKNKPCTDSDRTSISIREAIVACERIYCGTVGMEYMHISRQEEVEWIRDRVETQGPIQFTSEAKKRILERLLRTALWEESLATKFPNDKRFGIDGGESYLPALMEAIDRCADHGIENIQMGICHRGHLNALHNVAKKPAESIFREFDPKAVPHWGVPGGVRYHYGSTCEWTTPQGRNIHWGLAPNSSHLESVNPI